MPYIIILKVRKFHQSTINRFGTAGKKPVGGHNVPPPAWIGLISGFNIISCKFNTVKSGLHINRKNRKHVGVITFSKLFPYTLVSHSCNDRRYSYVTRNISNRCIDNLKILTGATSEACSAIDCLRLLFVLATEHTLLPMFLNIWRQILFLGDLHEDAL